MLAIANRILASQPEPPRAVGIMELAGVDLTKEVSAAAVVFGAVVLAFLAPPARSIAILLAAAGFIGLGLIILSDLNQKADALRRGVMATGRIIDVSRGYRSGPIVTLHVSSGSLEVNAPSQPWTFSSIPHSGQSIRLLADPQSGWPLMLLGPA